MSRVEYFLIFALVVVGIILAIKIENELIIKRERRNAQIISSIFHNRPLGTINKIYGMYFLNREVALNYCKLIPKKEADGYAIVIDMQYPFVASNHFSGSYVGYYVKNCEDLPYHSICMDQNTCLIKYGDE